MIEIRMENEESIRVQTRAILHKTFAKNSPLEKSCWREHSLRLKEQQSFQQGFSLIIIIMIKLNHSSIDGVRIFEI